MTGKHVLAATMIVSVVVSVVAVINNTQWDNPPTLVGLNEFHRTHKMVCKFPMTNKIDPGMPWQTAANCKGDIPKGKSVPMTCVPDVKDKLILCTEIWVEK